MTRAFRWLGRGLVLALLIGVIGVLVDTPAFTAFPADQAMIRLSFSHGGARDCRERTAEELAALPPNMRSPTACARERLPVLVELDLDGQPLFRRTIPPSGLHGDGPSRVHEGFVVAPGTYTLDARLRDSGRPDGFDYTRTATLTLASRQNLVIEFRSDAGGFVLHEGGA